MRGSTVKASRPTTASIRRAVIRSLPLSARRTLAQARGKVAGVKTSARIAGVRGLIAATLTDTDATSDGYLAAQEARLPGATLAILVRPSRTRITNPDIVVETVHRAVGVGLVLARVTC
jgi:hypothetical protein